jgi:hypothetical protein
MEDGLVALLPVLLSAALASQPDVAAPPPPGQVVAGQLLLGGLVSSVTYVGVTFASTALACSSRCSDATGRIVPFAAQLAVVPLATAGAVHALAPDNRSSPALFARTWIGAAIFTLPPAIALAASWGGSWRSGNIGLFTFGVFGGLVLPPIGAVIGSSSRISAGLVPTSDGVALVASGWF